MTETKTATMYVQITSNAQFDWIRENCASAVDSKQHWYHMRTAITTPAEQALYLLRWGEWGTHYE